jgi:hypothetical protein
MDFILAEAAVRPVAPLLIVVQNDFGEPSAIEPDADKKWENDNARQRRFAEDQLRRHLKERRGMNPAYGRIDLEKLAVVRVQAQHALLAARRRDEAALRKSGLCTLAEVIRNTLLESWLRGIADAAAGPVEALVGAIEDHARTMLAALAAKQADLERADAALVTAETTFREQIRREREAVGRDFAALATKAGDRWRQYCAAIGESVAGAIRRARGERSALVALNKEINEHLTDSFKAGGRQILDPTSGLLAEEGGSIWRDAVGRIDQMVPDALARYAGELGMDLPSRERSGWSPPTSGAWRAPLVDVNLSWLHRILVTKEKIAKTLLERLPETCNELAEDSQMLGDIKNIATDLGARLAAELDRVEAGATEDAGRLRQEARRLADASESERSAKTHLFEALLADAERLRGEVEQTVAPLRQGAGQRCADDAP